MPVEKDQYVNELLNLIKYQYGYDVLIKHFNDLPDEVKPEVHKELKQLGL